MNEKTATSLLLEFCAQQKVTPPQYEAVNHDGDPKVFLVLVKAFDHFAQGMGLKKMEAKHSASQNMIDTLVKFGIYGKSRVPQLKPSPPPPPPKLNIGTTYQNNDAVGALITLCQQHQLYSPRFDEVSCSGEPHKREFVFSCSVGDRRSFGSGPNKKDAKQFAAAEMLNELQNILLNENVESSDTSSTISSTVTAIPAMKLPTLEEVLQEYRRLKKSHVLPVEKIRYRKNFFQNLPEEKKQVALDLLGRYNGYMAKDVVDQILRGLNLHYRLDCNRDTPNHKVFSLQDAKYDCVIIDHEDRVFEKVIDYLKTMLNFNN